MKSLKDWQKITTVLTRSSSASSKALRSNSAAAKAISLLLLGCAVTTSLAIILYGTADPEVNTTAPSAALAANGWNLQGFWGANTGTPIGPHHFITAAHVGGSIGQVFSFRGVNYTTVSATPDPSSDFQIWEIAGTFPEWAQLYDGNTETGLDMVVFGRGSIRGAEVRVNGALKGWQWGAYDARLRWGQNKVSSIINDPSHSGSELLVAQFNSNATANEAHLGYGDSGGGVFILENSTWRLAGINFSVDGAYNTVPTGGGFNAAIFDQGGLYKQSQTTWVLTPDLPTNQAGAFYATRIQTRLSWIQSVLASSLTPALVEAPTLTGPFSAVSGATFDANSKTIQLTPAAGTHFYRIENLQATITSSALSNGTLTLKYQ
jgi:hypothetical protein